MFPFRWFLYKFTLDNSNHKSKNSVLQSETLKLFQTTCILSLYFFVTYSFPIPFPYFPVIFFYFPRRFELSEVDWNKIRCWNFVDYFQLYFGPLFCYSPSWNLSSLCTTAPSPGRSRPGYSEKGPNRKSLFSEFFFLRGGSRSTEVRFRGLWNVPIYRDGKGRGCGCGWLKHSNLVFSWW